MSEEESNPELQAFETALTSLRPTPANVDRDRIMFAAGRRAGRIDNHRRRGSQLWPLATIATGIVAFACGMTITSSPELQIVQRTVYVEKDIWPTIEEVSEPVKEKLPHPFGLALHTSRSRALAATPSPSPIRLPEREMTQSLDLLNRPVIRAHSIRDLERMMDYSVETDGGAKGNENDVDHEGDEGCEESGETKTTNPHSRGQYGFLFSVLNLR